MITAFIELIPSKLLPQMEAADRFEGRTMKTIEIETKTVSIFSQQSHRDIFDNVKGNVGSF